MEQSGVQTAFKALGMDSSTVSQFAPALLEIFKQYISPENLNLTITGLECISDQTSSRELIVNN